MENSKNQDSLENLFSQMFNEEELLMKKEGWNAPSTELWDSIEEQLPKSASKKRILYSHWIATAASVLLLVSCFQLLQYQQQFDLLSNKLMANENAVLDMKKEMAAFVTVKKVASTEESSRQSISKAVVEKIDFSNKLPKRDIAISTTKIPKKTRINADNQLSTSSVQFAVIAASLSSNSLGMEVESNLFRAKQTKTIASTEKLGVPKKARRTATITPLPIPLNSLVIEQKKSPVLIPPVISTIEKKHNWYLTASIAPVRHKLKVKELSRSTTDLVAKEMPQEKAFAANIQAGIQFANNWSVESGIRYAKYQHLSSHSKQIPYSYLEEHLNIKGDYESNLPIEIESGAAIAAAAVILSRSATTTIEPDVKIKVAIDFSSSLAFIDIPLLIAKQWQKGNWNIGVKAGLSNRFLVKNGLDVKQVKLNDDRFSTEPVSLQAKHNADDPSIYSARYLAAIDVAYAIRPNLDIYVSPAFSRSVQPIAESNQATIHSQEKALNVGVRYHL